MDLHPNSSDGDGEKVIRFIEKLRHPEGTDWAGELVVLLVWQKDLLRRLFARGADGKRIIRQLMLWLGRGNGKTSFIAFLCVYLLFKQRNGSIVVSANTQKEALTLYEFTASIIQQDPWLARRCRIYKGNQKRIDCHHSKSKMEVLSAEFRGKLGGNVSVFIAEECGFYRKRNLFEAIETSMGKRVKTETLIIGISTAGDDQTSYGYELFQKTQKIIANPAIDPHFHGVIYQGDAAKWDQIEEWYRCNPSLRELGSVDYITGKINSAKETPTELPGTLRFHFNIWQEGRGELWIPPDRWDAATRPFNIEGLKGKTCYVGIDIASRNDMSAVCALFPLDAGLYVALMWYFTPEDTLARREHTDKAPYSTWKRQGFLRTVPGDFMDTGPILDLLIGLRTDYWVQEVGIDPAHGAGDLTANLQKEGFSVVWVQQGWKTIVPTTREIETLVAGTRLIHLDNPVLKWNVQNIRMKMVDDAGNLMPSKKLSTSRIDGVFALIDALAREMAGRSRGRPVISI